MIGQTIAHYKVTAKLGAGGMGEVYRATDTKLERDVALKVLPAAALADSDARERLLREARTAAALNHPHICTVHEVGEAGGQLYFAMELVQGQPLSALVAREALPFETVIRYGTQIADALAHAHDQGVVHRDLKSANVVITPEGRAKVLDFGLAVRWKKEINEATRSKLSIEEQPTLAGTLPYMAPEVLRGQTADARSDIWALGVMLYEMAAGQVPFRGQTGFDLTSAILRDSPPPLPPNIPPGLRGVIERCLAKDSGQRYQRGSEVRAVLEVAGLGTGRIALAPDAQPVAPPFAKRGFLWPAVLAAALAAALAALFAFNVGGARERLFGSPGTPRIESLAVLPLENFSRDPGQDYFADGMTDALIASLSQISGLKVISRTSMMQYKGTKKPLPEIGRELGVDAVIEGSVQRANDRVRITAQLIETATDRHLWARTYERDLPDVLKLQDEVARAIATEVSAKLTPQEAVRLASARTLNPEAHDLYLKGRHEESAVTIEGFNRAIDYFREAIARDPSFAPAYAGMAESYHALAVFGGGPPRELYPKAQEAAARSLELDDGLSDAHISRGLIKTFYEWDWFGAEREFKRGLQLKPNSADGHMMYFLFLTGMGRLPEASREIEQAVVLDPLAPTFNRNRARMAWMMGNYDLAIERYREISKRYSGFVIAHRELGYVYAQKGMVEAALDEELKAVSLSRDPYTLASLGRVYAVAGKKNDAMKVLAELQERSKRSYVAAFHIAEIYAALGQKEDALRWLEKAYQERHPYLLWLRWYPSFDSLRSEPRFQNLVRRMNFPQ